MKRFNNMHVYILFCNTCAHNAAGLVSMLEVAMSMMGLTFNAQEAVIQTPIRQLCQNTFLTHQIVLFN